MSDSVWPHRWQLNRLPHPWDSPGKNTGVGCHFLLQCMKVKSESEVAQLCLTLSNLMDCRLPSMGFSRQEYWSGVPLPWQVNGAIVCWGWGEEWWHKSAVTNAVCQAARGTFPPVVEAAVSTAAHHLSRLQPRPSPHFPGSLSLQERIKSEPLQQRTIFL